MIPRFPYREPEYPEDDMTEEEVLLLDALERHVKMFDMVLDKVDIGKSFLDAETIREWNEASIQATKAIRKVRGG